MALLILQFKFDLLIFFLIKSNILLVFYLLAVINLIFLICSLKYIFRSN